MATSFPRSSGDGRLSPNRPYKPPPTALTAKQKKVVGLVALGMTNREITQAMNYQSIEGSKRMLHRIFKKLGIHSRCQLVVWYYTKGKEDG